MKKALICAVISIVASVVTISLYNHNNPIRYTPKSSHVAVTDKPIYSDCVSAIDGYVCTSAGEPVFLSFNCVDVNNEMVCNDD